MLLISSYDHSWSAFLFAVILISSVNIFVSHMYLPLGYIVAIGFGLFPWMGIARMASKNKKRPNYREFLVNSFFIITRHIRGDRDLKKFKKRIERNEQQKAHKK